MSDVPVKPVVEAALLASAQPLTMAELAALFEVQEQIDVAQIAHALEELKLDSEGRGVELIEVSSGFRYQVRSALQTWVARLWTERQPRYSRAMLETLALIAYRQPITRGEIEQIRGVSVSSQIIKTLEEREWVRVLGHRDVPGRPALLGTTAAFLDYFQLRSLDGLPPLAAVRDIDAIDPELPLGDLLDLAVAARAATAGEHDSARHEHPQNAIHSEFAPDDRAHEEQSPSDVQTHDDEDDTRPGADASGSTS